VGVNITCRLRGVHGKVALSAEIDVSTEALPEQGEESIPPAPTIGNIRADVGAILDPDQPATGASIDDTVAERKFTIEATVTKLD